jgi:hypothetical protein
MTEGDVLAVALVAYVVVVWVILRYIPGKARERTGTPTQAPTDVPDSPTPPSLTRC